MSSHLFEEMSLRFHSTPEGSMPVKLDGLTIIIGPNNTGKSTLLREIRSAISDTSYNPNRSVVLGRFDPRLLSAQEADDLVMRFELDRDFGFGDDGYHYGFAKSEAFVSFSRKDLIFSFSDKDSWQRKNRQFAHIASLTAKMLDGQSRLNILNDAPLADLRDSRSTYSLKNAYLANDLTEINAYIREAFGLYLTITNVTNTASAVAFLTRVNPTDVGVNPKLLDNSTIDFFSNTDDCIEAKNQSDGTKAFIGLMLELFYSPFDTLLIDEPEAFLHPTLAYLLGAAVGKCSSKKQVICSTHSVDFLRGCLDSVKELNLLRLTRDRGGSVHVFKSPQLKKMQNDPLLRTASVMNGLFFSAAIVVEGDSDEAFYREINYRLSEAPGFQAISNAQFITSHGVDTEYKIVSILRNAGIPAACIVDFDFLKKPAEVFGNLLSSANITGSLFESFKAQKQAVANAILDAVNRKTGLNELNPCDAGAVNNLINALGDYGIFVVPNGSLESWLSYLNVETAKNKWLNLVFEKLGDDPASSSYIHPEKRDVWVFLEKIAVWISNPERKGMSWTASNPELGPRR